MGIMSRDVVLASNMNTGGKHAIMCVCASVRASVFLCAGMRTYVRVCARARVCVFVCVRTFPFVPGCKHS